MNSTNIIEQIQQAIGAEYVLVDPADREFYATDVFNIRELPIAVVQPGSLGNIQAIARIAAAGN